MKIKVIVVFLIAIYFFFGFFLLFWRFVLIVCTYTEPTLGVLARIDIFQPNRTEPNGKQDKPNICNSFFSLRIKEPIRIFHLSKFRDKAILCPSP